MRPSWQRNVMCIVQFFPLTLYSIRIYHLDVNSNQITVKVQVSAFVHTSWSAGASRLVPVTVVPSSFHCEEKCWLAMCLPSLTLSVLSINAPVAATPLSWSTLALILSGLTLSAAWGFHFQWPLARPSYLYEGVVLGCLVDVLVPELVPPPVMVMLYCY